MRLSIGLFAMLALLVAATSSKAADMISVGPSSRGGLELQSGANRLALDPDTGRVSLLTGGARTLVARPRGLGPLRLHVPLSDYQARMVEAHQTRPVIEPIPNGFTCTYARLSGTRGSLPIKAVVKVLAVGDGSFELSCTVRNDSDTAIPQVFFPWIGGFAQIDGPEEDRVTFGKSQIHPWKKWPKQKDFEEPGFMAYLSRPEVSRFCGQPYLAGMKWMDYSGQSMGISLFAKDAGSRSQTMLVSMEKQGDDAIDLAWYHYPFIQPGQSWQSPTFALFPHDGDWRHGVLKFKEFTQGAFRPVPSTPVRDENIGQFSLWLSWHYQDWQDARHRFKDIPGIAAEAREAGLREMTLVGITQLNASMPPAARKALGTDAELKEAVEEGRKLGVNVIPLTGFRLVRPGTIPTDEDKEEWYLKTVAGQPFFGIWTYDPKMIPKMPVRQFDSDATVVTCPGSRGWREAFLEFVEEYPDRWGYHGVMLDVSFANFNQGLCFNPLHEHPPDAVAEILDEVITQARARLGRRVGGEATISGESLWDAATEWTDFTWDWHPFDDEDMAPFHMAFPRARQSIKCTDKISLINRIFTAGYWLDVYLEDGVGRLKDYPELTDYLKSLAAFKKQFVQCLGRRDAYLHDMFVQSAPADGVWVRVHRSGKEALVLATHRDGAAASVDLQIDLKGVLGEGEKKVEVWSRGLEKLSSRTARDQIRLRLDIPAEDFVAVHLSD